MRIPAPALAAKIFSKKRSPFVNFLPPLRVYTVEHAHSIHWDFYVIFFNPGGTFYEHSTPTPQETASPRISPHHSLLSRSGPGRSGHCGDAGPPPLRPFP